MTDFSSLPCVAIAGPTASGKTAAALQLAARLAPKLPVEIISVDSALVYRGMDIGTAKPTRDELAQVPHHLIDILDPLEAYSAAEFVNDTNRLIAEIHARGALPVLVGGTMLYFKALIDGIDDMPAADPLVRARLDAQAAEIGWPAMHAELAKVDPATAARLAPGDSQRIQRALEVWHVSGQPLSSFHSRQSTEPAKSAGSPLAANALYSLEPTDRKWLHERIAQRFHAMLRSGFLDEMQQLRARGDLNPDLPSMRCVGYRQAWESMDGTQPMSTLAERGIAATRQLAKRQITWLRSMPQRHVVACDQADAGTLLVDALVARVHASGITA
ncbi:tRNA (adenosine(37)-N6)-dimethylallyltransferase MiaA [Diaphorobacter caeni]|uniref:tRNA (adenosine(37)-N6)-dimethylallyltransferase MiaA n=1 Tax=Diaphorobacter caeni TaxID=2784387 RepID=UPI0018906226|nr:tRNA (adenosine(37)-N6)-dimethylallyltransferase MiaA [Diaphorobacter caeni]MBF5003422.1 tRNA (adenosine(37)-N6)-dimethylallyltransferase MiaA [Diaphorobacter caeni]